MIIMEVFLLFALVVIGLSLILDTFSLSRQEVEEKRDKKRAEEADRKVKEEKERKGVCFVELNIAVNNAFYLYLAEDEEEFAKRWNIRPMLYCWGWTFSYAQNGEKAEILEAKRIVGLALKIIAIALEGPEGLFGRQTAIRTKIEKKIRYGKNDSVAIEEFESIANEKRKIEEEITKAKSCYDRVVIAAKNFGLPILDDESYKYKWYYVLDISKTSYSRMEESVAHSLTFDESKISGSLAV